MMANKLREGRVLWIKSEASYIKEGIDGGAIFDVTANSVRDRADNANNCK